MSLLDTLLKQLVTGDARAVAEWLLGSPVVDVQPLTVELPTEPVRADAVFLAWRADGQRVALQVEFQGRSSRPAMRWRMLGYMVRIAQEYRIPFRSVVLYVEPDAGSTDSGYHEHPDADGGAALTWRYQVIHLWRMTAEELLALGRPSLLPLAGLTTFENPAVTVPKIVTAIRSESQPRRQALLLGELLGLLRDEEVIAMVQRLLTEEDIEELKQFPWLWRNFQRMQEEMLTKGLQEGRQEGLQEGRQEGLHEGLKEGRLEKARQYVFGLVAKRFNLTAEQATRVREALEQIEDPERLDALFDRAALARDFADFAASLDGLR